MEKGLLFDFCVFLDVSRVRKAGRLIDSDSGTVLTDQTIVIRDNKFDTVGRNLSIPANATVIDLSKMTVLPGLITATLTWPTENTAKTTR